MKALALKVIDIRRSIVTNQSDFLEGVLQLVFDNGVIVLDYVMKLEFN